MKNRQTLNSVKNVIREEIQFQLTKKQLFENLDRKTLKRILNEGAVSVITYTKNINIAISEPFRIVNPNPNDKITTIVSKNPSAQGSLQTLTVKFIYKLQALADSAEYGDFMKARKENEGQFFSTDKTSLIIANHANTIQNTLLKKYPKLSYTLDLEVTYSSNVQISLAEFKGQKVTQ